MSKTFKLISNLGKGGFGNVDLVEAEDGTRFARKTFAQNQSLSKELLVNVIKRFKREATIQGGIQHPNIVPVVESDLEADPPWYVMPVANSTLYADMEQDRTLGGHFIAALSDIVAGLEELHSMEIYHRDLKPQNVLRFDKSSNGQTVTGYALSDFGLISLKESQISGLTTTGMARGSDHYAAPEVTMALRHASAQSDIYSLGCILHDMVATNDRVPCAEIREDGPFGPILLGCTRKDPGQRFKTVRAVLDAILSVDLSEDQQPSQTANDLITELQSEKNLNEEFWHNLADYLEHTKDKREIRAICLKLTIPRIKEVCTVAPESADRVAIVFAGWVGQSNFDFESCDGLADRLEAFYLQRGLQVKVECLMAMLEMGTSHNRWYVERKFFSRCGPEMDSNLAKRLGIQFRISGDDVCRSIDHLEGSIEVSRTSLHTALVKALEELCK